MRLGAEYITIVLQQVIVASHNTTGSKAPHVHLRWKLYNDACSCTYSGDLRVGFLTQKIDHNVDQSLSKDPLYNTLMSLTNVNLRSSALALLLLWKLGAEKGVLFKSININCSLHSAAQVQT